jgi:hypothetical protein
MLVTTNQVRASLLVSTRIVIAHHAKSRIGHVSVSNRFRIAGEIADSNKGERVHVRLRAEQKCSSPPPHRRPSPSRLARPRATPPSTALGRAQGLDGDGLGGIARMMDKQERSSDSFVTSGRRAFSRRPTCASMRARRLSALLFPNTREAISSLYSSGATSSVVWTREVFARDTPVCKARYCGYIGYT